MKVKEITSSLVSLLVFLFAAITQFVKLSPDPDTFWHLSSGKWILANHRIPYYDPFNLTNPRKWIDHEWLSQVFFSFFNDHGYLYLIGFVAIINLLILIILYRFLRSKELSKDRVNILVFLSSATLTTFIQVRPQIFTYLLSLILVIILEKWNQSWKWRWLYLSLIIILWVNLHGGGIGFAYVITVGYLISFLVEKQNNKVKEIAAFLPFSVLLQLINPYGFSMITYPYQVMVNADMSKYIAEWKSPDFHSNIILLVYIVLVVVVLAISRKRSFRNIAFIIGLLVMSLVSVRHAALLFLLTPVFLAESIAECTRTINAKKVINWTIFSTLIIFSIIVLAKGKPTISNILIVESSVNPTSAYTYLSDHNISGPIYNSYNFGGSLLYNFNGRIIPSSDGRADMYTGIYNPEDYFHQEVSLLYSKSPNPNKFLELHSYKILLVESDSWLNQWLLNNKNYKLLYKDEIASIYDRR